jgi:hypothetical protein
VTEANGGPVDGPHGKVNKGVSISGGSVSDSVIVAGTGNEVSVAHAGSGGRTAALAEARTQTAELLRVLNGGGHPLAERPAERAQATMAADELAEELAVSAPDRGRVTRWLTRLAALVAGVAPLAEIVVAIEESVKLALGA